MTSRDAGAVVAVVMWLLAAVAAALALGAAGSAARDVLRRDWPEACTGVLLTLVLTGAAVVFAAVAS